MPGKLKHTGSVPYVLLQQTRLMKEKQKTEGLRL